MDSIIVIGASAGGVEALPAVVGGLPADFAGTVLIVMHIGDHPSSLPELLARQSVLPVAHACHGQTLLPGTILVAPPGRHLMIARCGPALQVELGDGPRENHARPAIDALFRSAAVAHGEGVTGVILTGYLDDGVAGLQAIKACGGWAIVQDPVEANVPDMPLNAIASVEIDLCLPLAAIAPALCEQTVALLQRVATTPVIPEPIALENLYASSNGDMAALRRIARPSPYSCPECGGALFTLNYLRNCRFRCHTGHSYTLLSLMQQQNAHIEVALWTVTRALQEKESLAEQLATEFAARSLQPDPGYAELARHARSDAATLRELLVRQRNDERAAQERMLPPAA